MPDGINLGMIPPQAVDLEEAVLGALLLEPKAIFMVVENLSVDTFYKNQHALIYKSILSLHQEDKPIDILTVTHALRRAGDLEQVGGPLLISQLTNKIASTANLEYHSMLLKQKYCLREIIRVSQECTKMAFQDDDVFEILDYQQKEIALLTDTGNAGEQSLAQLLPHVDQNLEDRKKGITTSVTTGFKEIDKLTRGWNKGNYIIIGAKSSMGKTAFMCSSVVRAARKGIPQGVFELEMTKLELMYRIVSQETGIIYEVIANGEMNAQEGIIYAQKYSEIAKLPIYIDDTPGLSVFDFNNRCRRMKDKHGVKAIWADYIQLFTLGSSSKKMLGNREQEVSFISKMMKRTAKQVDLPLIALSQLNKEDGKRAQANKRPILSDLRESSALEHDPDLVAFIHRPERTGEENDENGNSTKGIAEFIVAKHRNGRLDIVKLKYIAHLMQFDNYISDDQYRMENFEAPHPDTFTQSQEKPF